MRKVPCKMSSSGTNDSGGERSTYTKMTDFKKKITLIEGQRKALFTTYEKEKKSNRDKEKDLTEEVLGAQKDLIKSQTTKETLLTKVKKRPHMDTKVLARLSPNSAIASLDYKVADLQKRLNKLRFRSQRKVDYLGALVKELKKMEQESQNTESSHFSKDELRQRFLENEIHKTSLKMMEADMVKKKYEVILDMLKKERMNYTKQINQMEDFIGGQNKEISLLEKDYDESITFRDDIRVEVKDWEDFFQQETMERNSKIMETKKELKEKRDIFTTIDSLLTSSDVGAPKPGPGSGSGSQDGSVTPATPGGTGLWPTPQEVIFIKKKKKTVQLG